MSGKKVLVAAAWPYVNGSLHLGHLAALLPADVLARYHRAIGDDVLFVSGSDCHGTPILVTAEREKRSPEDVARQYHEENIRVLTSLGFTYSLYSLTMGQFHIQAAQRFFKEIYEQEYLVEKEEEQAYCPKCTRFLPDRYVLGICPYCNASRIRGDQCDACGKLVTPEELLQPFCRVCESVPVWKMSRHLYFDLPQFEERLKLWIEQSSAEWRINAVAQTKGQLAQGLHPRAVTRDLLWGVPVPVQGFQEKRMYVWFEAVMGYLTCSQEWAAKIGSPDSWREWWSDPAAIHYYVHGKDNIPFHTIIWPAMLMALKLHLPNKIVSSEYLTMGTQKFSKGEGVGVFLPEMLNHFDPDAIRFFLIFQGPETNDTSFQWEEFQNRINGDLIDNLGNLWNRVCSMAHRYFGGVPLYSIKDPGSEELIRAGKEALREVGSLIERLQFRVALRSLLALSSQTNRYIEQRTPWSMIIKDKEHVAETIGVSLEITEALRRMAAPFMPQAAKRLGTYLGKQEETWRYVPLLPNTPLAAPQPLFKKILEEKR
jgi:methionyl-tRNA synthetase